jgi:Domain of unknown function (DUF5658)
MTPLGKTHVIFPNGYVWFVFVSALDIMLTWVVLHLGGREANGLANEIIYRYGLPGLVIFKFALVILVVLICEVVGRRKHESARLLLSVGIMITCMPVVLAFGLMLFHL